MVTLRTRRIVFLFDPGLFARLTWTVHQEKGDSLCVHSGAQKLTEDGWSTASGSLPTPLRLDPLPTTTQYHRGSHTRATSHPQTTGLGEESLGNGSPACKPSGQNLGQTLKTRWFHWYEICTVTRFAGLSQERLLRKFCWDLDGIKYLS